MFLRMQPDALRSRVSDLHKAVRQKEDAHRSFATDRQADRQRLQRQKQEWAHSAGWVYREVAVVVSQPGRALCFGRRSCWAPVSWQRSGFCGWQKCSPWDTKTVQSFSAGAK